MHVDSEKLKQRLESMDDYNADAVFQTVDSSNIHYIDIKCLDNFFKRNKTKGIVIEDNAAIIRRLDLDNDSRLNKDEFLKGIVAQEPFSRMLIRAELKKEAFGKIDHE